MQQNKACFRHSVWNNQLTNILMRVFFYVSCIMDVYLYSRVDLMCRLCAEVCIFYCLDTFFNPVYVSSLNLSLFFQRAGCPAIKNVK